MSKLLDDKYSYLLSEVEPELVPVGVPRTCFNLEEIKTLYGKICDMIYEMLYKKRMISYIFLSVNSEPFGFQAKLLESKSYPNGEEDNTFFLCNKASSG